MFSLEITLTLLLENGRNWIQGLEQEWTPILNI